MIDLLRHICAVELDYEVVGAVSSGPEAVAATLRTLPDILLLDIELPGHDGLKAIELIRAAQVAPRCLVISAHFDEYTIYRAQQLFVAGFLDKPSCRVEVLKAAISAVAEGRVYYSDTVMRIRGALRNTENSITVLSNRERDIMVLIGNLLSDPEIAARLNISDLTAEKHRHNIQHKLGIKSRIELVRFAQAHGFLTWTSRVSMADAQQE